MPNKSSDRKRASTRKRTTGTQRAPARREVRAGAHKRAAAPEPAETGPGTSAQSRQRPFEPKALDKTVIALPLLQQLDQAEREPDKLHAVVIDLNVEFPDGVPKAGQWVIGAAADIIQKRKTGEPVKQGLTHGDKPVTQQYLYGQLTADVIRALVRRDAAENVEPYKDKPGAGLNHRAIYHIWPDFKVRALVYKSISTVKADAAHASFAALGKDIVWAVLDSGIDVTHPHFQQWGNLVLDPPLDHEDFTGAGKDAARHDPCGHGTHVAGIIAGAMTSGQKDAKGKKHEIIAMTRVRTEMGNTGYSPLKLTAVSGMAPRCKLVSFRVLDEKGEGQVSSVLQAIARIQEINSYGRHLLIHGVNMSIGYPFDPEWFACGQSPLCVEVDRLVRSGVVVVVSAGNSGYGLTQSQMEGVVPAALGMTICDPGNAELAITVGSTHRDSPHIYGVSYFSSKGPTGDGRAKPDLVAPGEKIVSCATGALSNEAPGDKCNYAEDSGTSMSAPHVSGVIAAFLSVRREFIGQPERVKDIFVSTATDLKRERYFQGSGLIDLMRAIQSV